MSRRRSLGAAVVVCLSAATLLANAREIQPSKNQATGSLTVLGQRTYKLSQAVAFETQQRGEKHLAILASDRQISWKSVQAALKANTSFEQQRVLDQPYLLILYDASGKARRFYAADHQTLLNGAGENVVGTSLSENGLASGTARALLKSGALKNTEFDIHWELTVGGPTAPPSPTLTTGPAAPSVTGEFRGNGKAARLAYVSAHPGEPFGGKPTIVIVFTEKEHAREAQPEIMAGFGEYGSALIITLLLDGNIIGCEVGHSAHGKRTFSTSGIVRTNQFQLAQDRITGRLTSDGERTLSDFTWSVALEFAVPCRTQSSKAPVSDDTGKERQNRTGRPANTEPVSQD